MQRAHEWIPFLAVGGLLACGGASSSGASNGTGGTTSGAGSMTSSSSGASTQSASSSGGATSSGATSGATGSGATSGTTTSGACVLSCPSGYSNNGSACVGGNNQSLGLAVTSYEVSGTVNLNGAPLSCAPGTYATLTFSSTTSAASFSALVDYAVTGGAFDIFVPPDTYSLAISQYEYGGCQGLPNGHTPVGMLTVGGTLTGQTLNLTSNEVAGTLSVNGTPVSCASGTYATLKFASTTSVASFDVLVDYAVTGGAFDSFLPADTYAITVSQYESRRVPGATKRRHARWDADRGWGAHRANSERGLE